MKRVILTLGLAAAVVLIGRAQTPNLSGTWRPQNSNSGQVNPFEFTITQTADSVTIRTPLNNPESVTLKLNGETRVPIGGRVSAGRGQPRRSHSQGSRVELEAAVLLALRRQLLLGAGEHRQPATDPHGGLVDLTVDANDGVVRVRHPL